MAGWVINGEAVSVFGVLDFVPGAHYRWVVDQTMNVVDSFAPAAGEPEDPDRDLPFEVRQLMAEVLSLAHASDALDARLRGTLRSVAGGLGLHDRAIMQIAS